MTRAARDAAGLCLRCGKSRDADSKHCSPCRAMLRKCSNKFKSRKLPAWKALGLCLNCGKDRVPGITLCVECREAKKRAAARLRERLSKKKGVCFCGQPSDGNKKECKTCGQRRRNARAEAIAKGICQYCKKRESEHGKTACAKCRDKRRRACRMRARRLYDLGLCTACGKRKRTEGLAGCPVCRARNRRPTKKVA